MEPSNVSRASPGESSHVSLNGKPSQGRISCDACKRMKIKCDKQGDKCSRCFARRLDCVITLAEKRRPKAKVDRQDTISQMESRVKRMESLLTASGVISEQPAFEPIVDKIQTQAALVDQLSTLVIDGKGASRFIGSSSGFSLFSPQGLKWIAERTSSIELSKIISTLHNFKNGRNTGSHTDLWNTLRPEEREPLPPKYLGDQYVASFFDTLNNVFPLFNQDEFMNHYEAEYKGKGPQGSAWYAALFAVLAAGSTIICTHRNVQVIKEASTSRFLDAEQSSQDHSWKYFRNASSVFTDLLFRDTGMLAIQAMVIMCLMLNTAVDPNSSYVLSSVVARAAHGIGLHRNLKRVGLSRADIETRRNVFWIIYFLEKSISLMSGRPSVINDDDIGVELPTMPEITNSCDNGLLQTPKLFPYQIRLALLESKIYTELYSAKGRLKNQQERLNSIAQLDKELQEFRDTIPTSVRPEHPILCSTENFIPVLIMHFVYLNAVATVHRILYQHGPWSIGAKENKATQQRKISLDPQFYASHVLCLAAARNTVQLLEYYSQRKEVIPRDGLIMMALEFPFIACLTLFVNTLQYPTNPHALSDVSSMKTVAGFIARSMVTKAPTESEIPLEVLEDLVRAAEESVKKAAAQGSSKQHANKDGEEKTRQRSTGISPSIGEASGRQGQDGFLKEKNVNFPPMIPGSRIPNDGTENMDQAIPVPPFMQFNDRYMMAEVNSTDNMLTMNDQNMSTGYLGFSEAEYLNTANPSQWNFPDFWDFNSTAPNMWSSEMALDPSSD